ncbi:Severe Depolymerization of Actin, partial [Borealophlyctis nickersoniae]
IDSEAEVDEGQEASDADSWEDVESGEELAEEEEGGEEASDDEEDAEDDEKEEDEEEDEEEGKEGESTEGAAEGEPSPPKKKKLGLAAEKIFTDEDFQKIKELRQEREAQRMAGIKVSNRALAEADDSDDEDAGGSEFVDVSRITAGIRRKNDYEARMEAIKSGREGRKYGSRKGAEERGSLTNKVKAKQNKAFMMVVHKRSVQGKSKRSLRDKQKALRAHVKKQKKH